jgi:hypothetical protein
MVDLSILSVAELNCIPVHLFVERWRAGAPPCYYRHYSYQPNCAERIALPYYASQRVVKKEIKLDWLHVEIKNNVSGGIEECKTFMKKVSETS